MRGITALSIVITFFCVAVVECAGIQPLSKAEKINWIRYTVPLPQSIDISGKLIVPKGKVLVTAPSDKGLLVEQAVKELNEITGGPASGDPASTITLSLGGKDAESLKSLKNSSQAYRIFPNESKGLTIAALNQCGLYYGAKTLGQLIAAKATDDNLEIPVVIVKDWPDMEERGLWGSDNYDHLKWMGDRKMNLVEQISAIAVTPEGIPTARIKEGREAMINEGPYYGIKPVPVVLHLEQVGGRVSAVFPETKGKSEHNGVMCYSTPKVTSVIAEWIAQLAVLPHVTDVDVWMAENLQGHKGCQCDKCVATGVDPMLLEARAIVKAWKIAEKLTKKKIGLRILTSEATEDFNTKILAELPRDVKVIYYHSLLTYTSGRDPMLRPYLAEFAKNGGWLGVCPNLSFIPHFTQPFTSPQFISYRMKEYHNKNVSCLLGYATPRVHYNYFNVEAAAEWGWNKDGRSTREFALSYGVRKGLKDLEKFADFVDCVGAVQFDVYGSDWPNRAHFPAVGPVDEMLKKGNMPGLGSVLWDFVRSPFGNIYTVKQLNNDLVLADRAVKLAEEMGIEEYIQESRITQGYIYSLKALYELRGIVKDGRITPEKKASAKDYFQMYVDSLRQVQDATPKWELTQRRSTDPPGFEEKPVKVIQEDCIDRMIKTAAELGVTVK